MGKVARRLEASIAYANLLCPLSLVFSFSPLTSPTAAGRDAREMKKARSRSREFRRPENSPLPPPGGAAFPCDWRRRSPPTRRLLPTCDNRAGSLCRCPYRQSFWHHARLSLSRLRRFAVDASMLSPCLAPAAAFPLPSRRPNDSPTSAYPIRGRGRARRGR